MMRIRLAALSLPLLLLSTTLTAAPAAERWTLDPQASTLSFVSIKNDKVAEVHHFKSLSGSVAASGAATLQIALDSVDTGITLRDERMQKLLFKTAEFANAQAGLDVDLKALEAVEPGASVIQDVDVALSLHGVTAKIPARLRITHLTAKRWRVTTAQPVIVNAGDFGLGAGIEALREVAGLEAIAAGVPVTLSLSFTAH